MKLRVKLSHLKLITHVFFVFFTHYNFQHTIVLQLMSQLYWHALHNTCRNRIISKFITHDSTYMTRIQSLRHFQMNLKISRIDGGSPLTNYWPFHLIIINSLDYNTTQIKLTYYLMLECVDSEKSCLDSIACNVI